MVINNHATTTHTQFVYCTIFPFLELSVLRYDVRREAPVMLCYILMRKNRHAFFGTVLGQIVLFNIVIQVLFELGARDPEAVMFFFACD